MSISTWNISSLNQFINGKMKPNRAIVSKDFIGYNIHKIWSDLAGKISFSNFSDSHYHTVDISEIKKADKKAWRPWKAFQWDCDNQTTALVYELRKMFYHDARLKYDLAAGTISGFTSPSQEEAHEWVWFIDHNLKLRFYDATEQREVSSNDIHKPFRALDK